MKNPICCLVLLLAASARSSSFSSPAFSPRSNLIRLDRANPGGVGGRRPGAVIVEARPERAPSRPPPADPAVIPVAQPAELPDLPSVAPVLSFLFAVASITDWFDGFLARRWDITSPFGAFLDPVADKLMVSTALIALAGRYGGIVAIPAAVIMAREVGVSALREWMAQQGKRDSVKVGMQGKVKAALTMVSLSLMLLVPGNVGLEDVAWTKYLGPLGVGGDSGDVPGRWPALDAWAEPAYALCKCCHHHHERERLLQGSMACFAGEGVVPT
ncbi:hypothetical protein THAOC_35332 [Thalassiosira oceanica]|uniref:CDP-diacylglycerol--glycerol-3-phosphate 3-phosphatidyltransferase n=1 Tax=Thalassiosira oceanica TaxID=159749 RepID=K0R130_THAOC|nr:hypothetical protein THAOC_35332 [Thalassiosira oceanica]|eukprot:EJK46028.1 hypothetical protein THAOC_35332 [Thalassiosira oceanica]